MEQISLFGDGESRLHTTRAQKPDPVERARRSLSELLGRLRSADVMPFTEREARMWGTVVPQMVNWLEPAEAEAAQAEFDRQMDRLRAA